MSYARDCYPKGPRPKARRAQRVKPGPPLADAPTKPVRTPASRDHAIGRIGRLVPIQSSRRAVLTLRPRNGGQRDRHA